MCGLITSLNPGTFACLLFCGFTYLSIPFFTSLTLKSLTHPVLIVLTLVQFNRPGTYVNLYKWVKGFYYIEYSRSNNNLKKLLSLCETKFFLTTICTLKRFLKSYEFKVIYLHKIIYKLVKTYVHTHMEWNFVSKTYKKLRYDLYTKPDNLLDLIEFSIFWRSQLQKRIVTVTNGLENYVYLVVGQPSNDCLPETNSIVGVRFNLRQSCVHKIITKSNECWCV